MDQETKNLQQMFKMLEMLQGQVDELNEGKSTDEKGQEMAWYSVVADDVKFKKVLNDMVKFYTKQTDQEVDAQNQKIKYLKTSLR